MSKIELGRIGAAISLGDDPGAVEAAAELDRLGYQTIWLAGGSLRSLDQIAAVVRATSRARVATGIISVDQFPADDVAALYQELERTHPGRFVPGLGGAHGADPFQTLNAYLDRLDATVPAAARLLAAMGPRMLDLARSRAAGALPVLITPEQTTAVRARLGEDSTLVVQQLAVLDADPDADPARARAAARGPLGFLGGLPAYQASFRRMGFTEEEIDQRADRLVDALIPHGDPAGLAAVVQSQLAAGADHVAVMLVADESQSPPLAQYRQLAKHLIPA